MNYKNKNFTPSHDASWLMMNFPNRRISVMLDQPQVQFDFLPAGRDQGQQYNHSKTCQNRNHGTTHKMNAVCSENTYLFG